MLFTAKGQLLASSASAAVGALAAGSDGQVLTADSTQPLGLTWAAPAGASGALTLISSQSLGADSASVSFTTIPGSYSALMVQYFRARDTNAGSTLSVLALRFNNDSGANYDYVNCTATNAVSSSETFDATSARIGLCVQGGATAGFYNTGQIWIPGYADSTQHKSAWGQVSSKSGASAGLLRNEQNSVFWRSASPITRLDLFSASGNLKAGSTWVLYGLT